MINPVDGSKIKAEPITSPPAFLYHATRSHNLGAIKRWGLIPRRTTEHNYARSADFDGDLCNQPVGVYTHIHPDGWWNYDGHSAVVVLRTNWIEAPVIKDPLVGDGRIVLGRVPVAAIVGVMRR